MLSANELDQIVTLAEKSVELGLGASLATVISVNGSSYRRPGARLLVRADGETAGCISGGCLERDVIRKCRLAMLEKRPRVVHYDMSDADGFGLGCGGSIAVLVEPTTSSSAHLSALRKIHLQQHPAVLITCCGGTLGERQVGYLALLTPEELEHRSPLPSELIAFIIQAAHECLESKRTRTLTCQLGQDRTELLFEYIVPRHELIIFGAGPEALPLARCAHLLGHHVTIVDERPGTLSRIRKLLPAVVACSSSRSEIFCAQTEFASGSACVIATHNECYDKRILRAAIRVHFGYIGLLGPKQRAERLLQTLQIGSCGAGVIHAPAGLDIGGDTPEQISLSILAEIQAVSARRSGGFLRDRNTPIHYPEETEAERAAA